MTAYYNEIDPYAAQWLRNLIDAGHIAPGIVDTRSIEDVYPSDLIGFKQCHWFAGVGVWSLALRRAGWPDDRPIWTGSCPCQPFSAAGKGTGFDDERHLWPAFHHLIRECKPAVVAGEQVASRDVDPWIDLVQDDLEALGYGVGAVAFPSAGVGAPHIRDRLYWVAHAHGGAGRKGRADLRRRPDRSDAQPRAGFGSGRMHGGSGLPSSRMADTDGRNAGAERQQRSGEQRQQPENGVACRLGQSDHGRREGAGLPAQRILGSDQPGAKWHGEVGEHGAAAVCGRARVESPTVAAGPTHGPWRAADWLACRDGKWRPVEPGTFPLAHGAPARVGRLRAYGNAINAEAARVFIECVMECLP